MTMPNADIETHHTSLHSAPGIQVVAVPGPDVKEYYITSQLSGNGSSRLRAETVSALLHDAGASVTCQRVFGPREIAPPASTAWARTWLLGNGGFEQSAASAQTYAIAGSTVTPVQIDGEVVGAVYEDADAVYYQLCGLRPTDLEASRPDQARELFDRIEQALQAAGMSVSDVVRTWFFVDRILEWYDEFNSVRTRFFLDHGVFDGVVPASTGVGMANAAGAALVVDVFAVRPKRMGMTPEESGASVEEVPSPLQCSALDYKSSFTRALELHVHSQRRLFISGTASITPDGESANFGDVDKQIELTMQVVHGILTSRQMDWADVTRGIAYFPDLNDQSRFERYCRQHRLPTLPLSICEAHICRSNLLFEIEVDAVAT